MCRGGDVGGGGICIHVVGGYVGGGGMLWYISVSTPTIYTGPQGGVCLGGGG